VTFQPNYDGIGQMLRSREMEAEMLRRAEQGKAFAEAIAPFDEHSKDGTHYKDAFRVESTTEGGIHHDRTEAKLINDDRAAFFVEFGTKTTPRHRTLGRSLDVMGG
jgi:hypothetical protein